MERGVSETKGQLRGRTEFKDYGVPKSCGVSTLPKRHPPPQLHGFTSLSVALTPVALNTNPMTGFAST